MCLTTHYISRNCGHHWLAIRQPCWPGYGFTYCGVFRDGVAREPSPEFEIMGLCPACAAPGYYDRNLVRMVTNVRERCRWGIGPSRGDPGVEHSREMLPTPDTSHVAYERVYEPAEDSFLLLDILSSASETAFLQSRFPSTTTTTATTTTTTTTTTSSTSSSSSPGPLVIEIGPGSGVVIAFLTAHASTIFGTRNVLTGAVDVNAHACAATAETVRRAVSSNAATAGAAFLGAAQGDLVAPLRDRSVDVLVFNPPYVPTAELPSRGGESGDGNGSHKGERGGGGGEGGSFEEDSYLLALSYAGGRDGMETTDRLLDGLPRVLSDRGCAYVLLCAQNKPEGVKERMRRGGWRAETVGSSGKQAGWEKLQIIRIWREL
ncbi:methyltransferase domain-containing protein [Xylaria acuta]|nr:methyltransferase domain-containing protein [Xylaria acuta]